MAQEHAMRDPTSEAGLTVRARVPAPKSLDGLTVAFLDIAKERSDEFLDNLESRFLTQGLKVKRYRKASNSKPAAQDVIQAIVKEADVVVEALAD